jgi:Reverse transcriptase (RNA-dependent DNA polymerase)
MEEKNVWEIVERKDVPSGRKVIVNKRVFAVKDDGRFRSRTVAKGYSQVPGKYFQGSFSPVINDTTIHLVLVLKNKLGLIAERQAKLILKQHSYMAN